MHVMEIVSTAGIDGVNRHCLLLSLGLQARGHRVTVTCLPDAWIASRLREHGIEVLPSKVSHLAPRDLLDVADYARRQHVDVFHTHHSGANTCGVLLKALCRIPCVATAHAGFIQAHWMWNDGVIATSDYLRRYLCRFNFVAQARVAVIHNFVEQPSESDPGEDRACIRAELGIPATAPLLGFFGRLERLKGLEYLLDAVKLLAALDVYLLVAGGGEPTYVQRLHRRAAIQELAERVVWAGWRQDMGRLRSATDVAVNPSLSESCPLAVLEALSAGTPVVATAVGGTPECIIQGECGLLVPPRDSSALATALARLLTDGALRRRFAEEGVRVARDRFSPSIQIPKIEQILHRVGNR